MQVIPVLDIKNGVVVRGIAGRRQEYRPVVSRLTNSPAPLDVARAFRRHFGLTTLYLADLDALAGGPPALGLYALLREEGFHLWVDAGIRHGQDANSLCALNLEGVVAGLETLAGPGVLKDMCLHYPERVVFSLDLKNGLPLGNPQAWPSTSPRELAAEAVKNGVSRIIVLDLAQVGINGGTGTETLCRDLALAHPEIAIIAGGGIRDVADLLRLRESGVRGGLVASALHDGRLTAENLNELNRLPVDGVSHAHARTSTDDLASSGGCRAAGGSGPPGPF